MAQALVDTRSARRGDLCPDCGKPLRVMLGRSSLTFFRERDLFICEGAPRCRFQKLMRK
jgi:ssDNA-binding Zn-finger/Zn-ribbon topoisomerase 1